MEGQRGGTEGQGEGGREGRWGARDGLAGTAAPGVGMEEGEAKASWGTGRRPSDLPSGPWADAGGSSGAPPGPGRRAGRSRGRRPPTARGADARGWGRRLGARPPHPRRRQRQAPGGAEAASMDPRPPPPPAGVTAGGSCRRGKGRDGGEGLPRPPPRGPQSVPGPGRTEPARDKQTGR